jgi:hypothetical protein
MMIEADTVAIERNGTGVVFSQLRYVAAALDDAESLLKFASDSGITVDGDTRNDVLEARAAFDSGLDEKTVAKLLIALGVLAHAVAPVTAQSLKDSTRYSLRLHTYRTPAVFLAAILAFVIVVSSTLSFVTTAIATSIRTDIVTANALAAKFTAEFGPPRMSKKPPDKGTATTPIGTSVAGANPSRPTASGQSRVDDKTRNKNTAATAEVARVSSWNPSQPTAGCPSRPADPPDASSDSSVPEGLTPADIVNDLQLYAATIRNIDLHARQLSKFTYFWNYRTADPYDNYRDNDDLGKPACIRKLFENEVPLRNYSQAAADRTWTYQEVRYFAQKVTDEVAFYYGAVSSCILPVLYALLGAAAYLLRKFERQVSARTFVPSTADSTRFLVAAIGGAVVGLFTNLTDTSGVTVRPLAVAFLVGYGVDVFYAALERMIGSFTKWVGSVAPRSKKQAQ